MLFALIIVFNLWFGLLRPSAEAKPVKAKPEPKRYIISFAKYYRYAQIQFYLTRLASTYPKLITLENYGLSYEGRKLTALYISTSDGEDKKKPIIFIDAGIHAREWIALAQALFILNQLLDTEENRYLIDQVDWLIIPLLNPDGYEYSHTVDRFWRKTRSKGEKCYGVDPNRNFNWHWGGMGTSRDECSNTYAGPEPFSEPETLALSQLIAKYARRTKLYISFHSAAQSFLHPWRYTHLPPPNVQEMKTLAHEAKRAVYAVNGTVYRITNSASSYHYASGCSSDFAYGAAGIPLAYMLELPPAPEGKCKFDMPPEMIHGVVTEMFEAIKVFHKYIVNRFVLKTIRVNI